MSETIKEISLDELHPFPDPPFEVRDDDTMQQTVAALVQNISVGSDISYAIWTCIGYTMLLCFTLFKTGSMAKSIFSAH